MRITRLARFFESKYGLLSKIATSDDRFLAEIKRDILDAYRNYFSRSARDSMFQYLSDIGYSPAKILVYKMDVLVKDIDQLTLIQIMSALKEILDLIYQMKTDSTKSARQAITDSLPGSHITQQNKRKQLLVKYERSISLAYPALQKIALKLQSKVPSISIEREDLGRQRERGELSKQNIIDFILKSPPFKDFGLTSLDIIEQLFTDPELKSKITTLINAVNRGHIPNDGFQIFIAAKQIRDRLEAKQKNNVSSLDAEQLPPITPSDEKEEE